MLGKLLKYDFRSNLLNFLLMYAVFLGITVLARISITMVDFEYSVFQNDVLSAMTVVGSIVLYFLGCGAVIILTYILVTMRFYNNLMGKEGYLSFTLPVTAGAHLASKMISGVVFIMASYCVLGISGVILTDGTGVWSGPVLSFYELFLDAVKLNNPVIFVLYIIKGLTGLAAGTAVIYLSVCIGQLAARHRVLAAIGVYIGINLVLGIITTLGSTIFLNLFEDFSSSVLYYGIRNTVSVLYQCAVTAGSLAGSLCLIKYRLNLE